MKAFFYAIAYRKAARYITIKKSKNEKRKGEKNHD